MSDTPPSEPRSKAARPGVSISEIDASCRVPLLVMFISAAVWLLIGSAFAIIASIKFHAPDFLARHAFLTYGRVHPAGQNAMLYGFGLQAGLGVGLWMIARLCRARMAQNWLATAGAVVWNLGVTLGVLGILHGDGTGFETLEIPIYGALLIFLGALLIGPAGVITFRERRQGPLFVSQWFVFSALFWFPWIYSTAIVLLLRFPVRGVTQAIIAWWYADNLLVVWLGLVGLGAFFYFLPKLTQREFQSRNLALLTYWMLLLAGTWGGIPVTAPVPAWLPTISTIATALMIIPILAVASAAFRTSGGKCTVLAPDTSLRFLSVGMISFVLAGLMRIAGALPEVGRVLHFTWFGVAQAQLHFYGFFAMIMFGAVYYIVPQITGLEFPAGALVRAHLRLALAGLVLQVVPLAIGGVIEGLKLNNWAIAFMDVVKSTLPFLRISTIGDLLIALGHVFFFVNLAGLANRFYRSRAASAYEEVTADLFKAAGVKS